MEERLRSEEFNPDQVLDALEYLRSCGYLDDRQYAVQYLESPKGRSGHGRAWLEKKLRDHGVPASLARETIDQTRDRNKELEDAIEAGRRMRRLKPSLTTERLAARLASRGYHWDLVRDAVRQLGENVED